MSKLYAALFVLLTANISFTAESSVQVGGTPDLERELEVARSVMDSLPLRAAFDYLERAEDETVQEWLSLCHAFAPSGREMPRSRLIYRLFQIYGLDKVHIDDAGNAIVGHHDRLGGPNASWNSVHSTRSCSQEDLIATGGDGLFYCFAAE